MEFLWDLFKFSNWFHGIWSLFVFGLVAVYGYLVATRPNLRVFKFWAICGLSLHVGIAMAAYYVTIVQRAYSELLSPHCVAGNLFLGAMYLIFYPWKGKR